jgi:hypothetical protein
LDAAEKAVASERKRSYDGKSAFKKARDKSGDKCRVCSELGHWAGDAECKGKKYLLGYIL